MNMQKASMQKTPYMLVLGDQEVEGGKVAVRERKQGDIGVMSLDEFKAIIAEKRESRSL